MQKVKYRKLHQLTFLRNLGGYADMDAM